MSTNDEIVEKLQTIVEQIKPDADIDIEQLRQIASDLENIRSQLQFERTDARKNHKWREADKLKDAEQECTQALDSVTSAILRPILIGKNQDNLQEMRKILGEVKTAAKTQERIDFIIKSLSFLRRILT
ncbi:hypothetical protein CLI64_18190 [Nostoc sp. CENA543]|uniref:hypothetical protein n=1 Tax=Nostoc sp. CENA543 TaxID=1869241 RepID=UPI000CA22971|nr:hypothetical protein [Nostoc sp. CENA543]AUT02157.1 hypothetical protein CLI64_18190 [Nostoc sp. CENA543]